MSGSGTGKDVPAPAAGGGMIGRVDRLEAQAAAKDGELEKRFDQLTTQLDLAHGAAMEAIALLAGKVVAHVDGQLAAVEAAAVARHEQLTAAIDAAQASIMDVVWELGARHPDQEPSKVDASHPGTSLAAAGAPRRDDLAAEAEVPLGPDAGADGADPEKGQAAAACRPDDVLAGQGVGVPDTEADQPVDAHRSGAEHVEDGDISPDPAPVDAAKPGEEHADADVDEPDLRVAAAVDLRSAAQERAETGADEHDGEAMGADGTHRPAGVGDAQVPVTAASGVRPDGERAEADDSREAALEVPTTPDDAVDPPQPS